MSQNFHLKVRKLGPELQLLVLQFGDFGYQFVCCGVTLSQILREVMGKKCYTL